MGYRSEVVLVVGKEVMPQFMVTMAKSIEARALCFADHDKMIKDYEEEGNLLFAWDAIKWYDSYECIGTLESFIEEASADEYEFEVDGKAEASSDHIRFVRVGEESDDIELRGDGFWDIYPSTSINY